MYDDTPNQEEIDWIAERMGEIYDYDKLKDCDIDYLHNQEFGMEIDAEFFEAIFPHEESAFQGSDLAAVWGGQNANRESLTEAEKIRIHMLKKEAEVEIHRAFGHRMELRREHRNDLANSISDALSSIVSLFPWK